MPFFFAKYLNIGVFVGCIVLATAGCTGQKEIARSGSVTIEDDVLYEERSHYRITTPTATYYYDTAGGGFSRIIDSDGNDWIGWHPNPTEYPASGAGMSRGLPNYQDGPGHPGHDACESSITEEDPKRIVIRSRCSDGAWDFTWTFNADYARNDIAEAPENIWFLYEGPIAGRFAPQEQYWGNDLDGRLTSTPNYVAGEKAKGPWRWVYFGDEGVDRVFFLAMDTPYTDKSSFAYMGAAGSRESPGKSIRASEGMVVFGFGREQYPQRHIDTDNTTFYIGFAENKVTDAGEHNRLADRIQRLLEAP